MKESLEVLMVGSSTKVKGGMTTVVDSFLRHKFKSPIRLTFIATHSEKGMAYNLFFFAGSLVKILFLLIVKNPRILHLHMSERGSFLRKYFIFKLAKAFRKKVIVHTHGAEFKEYYSVSSPAIKRRIKELLGHSDKVIALGEKWKDILLEIEPKADVVILMNAVPLPLSGCEVKKNGIYTILFLAVLTERKGILDLIHASAPVIQEAAVQKKQLSFEIAGDGELLGRAEELVDELGLRKFYRFHGWADNVEKAKLLKKADLFVLPSYNEGLPMSILEALSYGIPVISTAVGSIDEAVKNGENGFLIQPGDQDALRDCLMRMVWHPAQEQLNRASWALAEEKFNEKKYFEQVEALYMDMVETKKMQVEYL